MSTCDPVDVQKTFISALLGSDAEVRPSSTDLSIYTRLKKYFTKPDASLDPSPEINAILSELVALLQGASKTHTFGKGTRFADVEKQICNEIDTDESLGARADAIRSIAIRSETRLELYWARHLSRNTCKVDPDLSVLEKVRFGSGAFPYLENYVNMVQTEATVIKDHLRPSLKEYQANRAIRVAFCGSGPLPLTGILLSGCLGAKVTLIDCDQESVHLSQNLITNWEHRGILPQGMVTVVCADGGQLQFYRSTDSFAWHSDVTNMNAIECDVLFVAALIPNRIKEDIARNVAEMRHNGPLVVLRTAHGLTARFAYFQNRRNVIERYLSFGGLVVPEVHEFSDGGIVDDDVKPIGFFPKDILNSLELFEWKGPMVPPILVTGIDS